MVIILRERLPLVPDDLRHTDICGEHGILIRLDRTVIDAPDPIRLAIAKAYFKSQLADFYLYCDCLASRFILIIACCEDCHPDRVSALFESLLY